MSQFDFCVGFNCNKYQSDKKTESDITPRKAFEQFNKTKIAKKHPSNNVSHEMTDSRENKRKVSIRQSMEDRSHKPYNNIKLDMSQMSEVKQMDVFDEQQDIKNLLLSMKARK